MTSPPPPDPRAGRVLPDRPTGVGDLLETAVRLVRGTGVEAALAVVIVLGPVHLLAAAWFAVLPRLLPGSLPDGAPLRGELTVVWVSLGVAAAAGLAGLLLTPLVLGAVVTLMGAHDAGRDLGWRSGLVTARSRWPSLLGASLIAWLLVLGAGLVALATVAVPAVILGAVAVPLALLVVIPALPALAVGAVAAGGLTYLVVPPVVLENRAATAAVRRAWRLLRVRFWPVVGIVLLAALGVGVVATPVGWLFQLLAVLPGQAGALALAAGGLASTTVTIVLGAAVALAVHADLRVRLGLRAGPAATPPPHLQSGATRRGAD